MANTSRIYKKGDRINFDELMDQLETINKEHFGGYLYIRKHDTNIEIVSKENGLVFWIEETSSNNIDDDGVEEKVADNYLEFRDCPTPDYLGWFQEIILRSLQSFGYTIFFDCIGEEMEVREYPKTYLEYCKRNYSIPSGGKVKKFIMSRLAKSIYKSYLKIAEENLPIDLYEYMFKKENK